MKELDFEPSIINNKVLKLCKRLNSCSLNDLTAFLESDAAIIETVLLYLEQEGLININNEIITVNDKPKTKSYIERKDLNLMKEFIDDEKLDIIKKFFCLEIPAQKCSYIINKSDSCILDYYNIIRKFIFERQLEALISKFSNRPQTARYRVFYNTNVYFYTYDNQVYISKKILKSKISSNYQKEEIKVFKKMYSYLSRIESHNKNANYLHNRLAEYIWRRNKSFEELYLDVCTLIK